MWGSPSGFPLTNHLALPGSESGFGLSQGPPVCECVCVCVCVHFLRWFLWVVDITYYEVTSSSFFDLRGAFLCSWEGLLDFKNKEYVVFYLSGQDPALLSSS